VRLEPHMTTPFPGATSVSLLDVYSWEAPDGLPGGSAHLHTACTEGYVVVGGAGRVQTLDSGGFTETVLTPRTVVWFGPGVIHRLINDGDLRIVVVMQNNGLPEAGDAVLTFPAEVLDDPERYADAATLTPGDDEASARRRQALSIEGFTVLRQRYKTEGAAALERFYEAAAQIVRPKAGGWRETWRNGPLAAAVSTGQQLDALEAGSPDHLREGRVASQQPAPRFGMCGRLSTYSFDLGPSV
jgi:mannose-6-phosphate isomerase-like protein (cupin superfamily)